jgi:hypothetical protein
MKLNFFKKDSTEAEKLSLIPEYAGLWSRWLLVFSFHFISSVIFWSFIEKDYFVTILSIIPIFIPFTALILFIIAVLKGFYWYSLPILIYFILKVISRNLGIINSQKILNEEKTLSDDYKVISVFDGIFHDLILILFYITLYAEKYILSICLLLLFLFYEIHQFYLVIKLTKPTIIMDNIFKDKSLDELIDYADKNISRAKELSGFEIDNTRSNIENEYYENGKLKFNCPRDKDGRKNGEYTMYYETGELYSKGKFKDDVLDGLSILYFKNGNKSSEFNYDKGILHGAFTLYYESGKIQENGEYKNGIIIKDNFF